MSDRQPRRDRRGNGYRASGRPSTAPGAGLALAPLRLFLGGTFVYAGVQKLTDPQFFDPAAAGYVGRQIAGMAAGSPLQGPLLALAVPHATIFGSLVTWGELAVGVATLVGLFLRAAAVGGLALSLVFYLTASWQVHPYFYGADIVFACAWLPLLLAGAAGTGLPALDTLLAPGTGGTGAAARTAATRRQFVWGSVAGIGGLLAVLLLRDRAAGTASGGEQAAPTSAAQVTGPPAATAEPAVPVASATSPSAADIPAPTAPSGSPPSVAVPSPSAVGVMPSPTTASAAPPTPAPAVVTPTAVAPAAAGGPVIAQAAQVPANSAATFAVPGQRAQGVLVHLADGRFVAFDAACTHAGCPVHYDPASGLLLCPCHGAEFDPARDAAVVRRPARTPLTAIPIHVDPATGAISTGA